jgi:hypothetical protein
VSTLRDKYFNTLGFSEHNESKRGKALDRAHELRRFEIEHYWKRATYFWGFQIAIFAAFGLLWREITASDATHAVRLWSPVAIALSGLGVLTAVANLLSADGSKFWQQNWENHIEMLEDKIEGRLYKTVWLSKEKASKGKTSFSVSRVNRLLSVYFVIFWIFVTIYVTWKSVCWPSLDCLLSKPAWGWWLLIIIVVFALPVFLLARQTSHLPGSHPNHDGSHGPPFGSPERQTFIRRYAPDEPDC